MWKILNSRTNVWLATRYILNNWRSTWNGEIRHKFREYHVKTLNRVFFEKFGSTPAQKENLFPNLSFSDLSSKSLEFQGRRCNISQSFSRNLKIKVYFLKDDTYRVGRAANFLASNGRSHCNPVTRSCYSAISPKSTLIISGWNTARPCNRSDLDQRHQFLWNTSRYLGNSNN